MQSSCADVISPYKRKCWTNWGGGLRTWRGEAIAAEWEPAGRPLWGLGGGAAGGAGEARAGARGRGGGVAGGGVVGQAGGGPGRGGGVGAQLRGWGFPIGCARRALTGFYLISINQLKIRIFFQSCAVIFTINNFVRWLQVFQEKKMKKFFKIFFFFLRWNNQAVQSLFCLMLLRFWFCVRQKIPV
jgi:hypothetical protein